MPATRSHSAYTEAMKFWTRRIARLLGIAIFFCVFALAIDWNDPWNTLNLMFACGKGLGCAALAWLLGYILSDMLFKNLVEHISTRQEDMLDAGLLQYIHTERSKPVFVQPDQGPSRIEKIKDRIKKKAS